jgi:hypothetical protein
MKNKITSLVLPYLAMAQLPDINDSSYYNSSSRGYSSNKTQLTKAQAKRRKKTKQQRKARKK